MEKKATTRTVVAGIVATIATLAVAGGPPDPLQQRDYITAEDLKNLRGQCNGFTLLPGLGIVSSYCGINNSIRDSNILDYSCLNPIFSPEVEIFENDTMVNYGLKTESFQDCCLRDINELVIWCEKTTSYDMVCFHAMFWDQNGCRYDPNNHASCDWYLFRGEIFGFKQYLMLDDCYNYLTEYIDPYRRKTQ